MEAEHSILPPSSAHIWGAPEGCTGWVKMVLENPPPDEPSEDAKEGNATHALGESMIKHTLGMSTAEPLGVNDLSSNGVVITDEMVEGAELYADDVTGTYHDLVHSGNSMKIGIEDKTPIAAVHSECFGTSDAWAYALQANELYIWDLKYGHRFVEIFENRQFICYAAGLMRKLNLKDDTTVIFRVIQPRSFHRDGPIREWRTTVKELLFYIGLLSVKAAKSLDFTTCECHSGPHCRDCDARHACETALTAGLQIYEATSAPISQKMSLQAMGYQLDIINRAVEQLNSLKTGFEAQIETTSKKGEVVPGWGLIPSVGIEAWTQPVEQVIALGTMLEMDLAKPGVKTPNQARKLGMSEDLLAAYAGRKQKGLKLVKDTESTARKIFMEDKQNE